MAKYMVRFDFLNPKGEWKSDYLSNNDLGLTKDEAEYIRQDLSQRPGHKDIRLVCMKERKVW